MKVMAKHKVQKIITSLVWVIIGSGTVMLLVAAISKKNNEQCTEINIDITGVQSNYFIDKKDVMRILLKTNHGRLEHYPVQKIDLATMETELRRDRWIREAELFFDNNNVLQVKVSEREPVSRVFTASGRSFYLDTSLTRLPLSDKFSARLPVFTNFPTDVIVLTKRDSNLLRQIKTLGEFIGSDPFWMAQIEQVDINTEGSFEIIPKMGNQIIYFGTAENYREKFTGLLLFYQQVAARAGWNKYSAIDLKFKGQVIGIRRGASEIKMDSLKALQIMNTIIANAQKSTNDSTNVQLIQPAEESNSINQPRREADAEPEEVPEKKMENDAVTLPGRINTSETHAPGDIQKKVVDTRPIIEKPPGLQPEQSKKIKKAFPGQQKKQLTAPKAVMPSKSDY